MLDEFAQLGHMEIIKDNYALMRGYGVKLWTVWQDLNQAKILYGDWWESFIGNAGMVQSFAPQDMTTRKYLSELGGERMTWHDVRKRHGFGRDVAQKHVVLLNSDEHKRQHQGAAYVSPRIGANGAEAKRRVHATRRRAYGRYFPDATHPNFAGVNAMMAEAAEAVKP